MDKVSNFLSALALIFITLKLTGVIHWSWWWVTAPLWGPFTLIPLLLAALIGLYITLFVVRGVQYIKRKQRS